jgi:hypothetical protein
MYSINIWQFGGAEFPRPSKQSGPIGLYPVGQPPSGIKMNCFLVEIGSHPQEFCPNEKLIVAKSKKRIK